MVGKVMWKKGSGVCVVAAESIVCDVTLIAVQHPGKQEEAVEKEERLRERKGRWGGEND